MFIAETLRGYGLNIKGRPLQRLSRLMAVGERRLQCARAKATQLRQGRLDLWILVELPHLLLQYLVGPHTARRKGPHPVLVFGAQGMRIEVLWPAVAGILQQLDQEEGIPRIGLPEAKILVVASRRLIVEVDVYQLP